MGSQGDSSNGTGVNSGAQADNSEATSGAVYLYRYSASTWAQEAYIKASNTEGGDSFGYSLALSSDGNKLAAGAYEYSNGTEVNSGAQADNSVSGAGAVYLY